GMLRMPLERAAEQCEPGFRFPVIRQQPRLGERQLELTLRVLGGIVIEQSEGLRAIAACEKERSRARARRQRQGRVGEPAVTRQRGFGISVARGYVGEVEQCSVVRLTARSQLRKPLLG